jgi:hypothetical protein
MVRGAFDRALEYAGSRTAIRHQTSAAIKIQLRNLWMSYHSMARGGVALPSIWDTGFRVFSEYDEDGLLLFLLAAAGSGSRTFVDIGAGDGVHASNCANLSFNLGFHGLFVDAREQSIAAGRAMYTSHSDTRRYPPKFSQAFVTAGTINDVVRSAGIEGDIDVLSIDIDGNDYWIWKAVTVVSPRIVIIETRVEYGLEDIVAPYDESFVWHRAAEGAPTGASPVAMSRLASELGYRLVGANRLGFNAVYLRNDVAPELIPAITVSETLWHQRNRPFLERSVEASVRAL